MSWLKGVSAVTYAVRPETIRRWAWFWIVGLGGELVSREDEVINNGSSAGLMRWRINLGGFDTILVAHAHRPGKSESNSDSWTSGDHSVISIDYAVDEMAYLKEFLDQHPVVCLPGTPVSDMPGLNFVQRKGLRADTAGAIKSHLNRIDHVTYAVTSDNIEECARFWIDGMGGTLVLRNDDVRLEDTSDSMMLWGIVLNLGVPAEEFGVALVAGIDKEQVSQVSRFVTKNGSNVVQHVAYDVGDISAFRSHFEGGFGANLLSETLIVPDGFGGFVKQVFGRGYESGNAAEVGFPEFLERLDGTGAGFTNVAGEGLYEKVQRISSLGDDTPIIDFSTMPEGWDPPEPRNNYEAA